MMASREKNRAKRKEKLSWFESVRHDFAVTETLSAASAVAWNHPYHDFYQHYTTLSSVLTKVGERQWWLTRSDSDTLNDRQESLKFGDRDIAARIYQASFVHGAAESAALWGLYTPSDPFAIRITIPGKEMERWIGELEGGFLSNGRRKTKSREFAIRQARFRDIIYAAVAFRDQRMTRWDVARNNGLYWSEVNSQSDIPKLEDEIKDPQYTGWLKDYEWRHERESRLCVQVEKALSPMALCVAVPPWLIKSMKFTFSPWLPREYEQEVEKSIRSVLKVQGDEATAAREDKRFRRSVLQGAMNLSRQKSTCQVLEKCLLESIRARVKGNEP